MPTVKKSILLPFTARQIYDVVEKVEDYPLFLPWCGGVAIHHREAGKLEASITIAFKNLKQTFRTTNYNHPPHRMEMNFVDGPFRYLKGQWTFEEMHTDGLKPTVKVGFELDYEFSNKLIAFAIGPVFNGIAQNFVDGFVKRAYEIYGQ